MTPTATKAGIGKEQSPGTSRGAVLPTASFPTSCLQNWEEMNSVVLSHLNSGHLLQQPEETNTGSRLRIKGPVEVGGWGQRWPAVRSSIYSWSSLRLLKPSTFYPVGSP